MLSPASVSPNPTNQLLRTEQQQLKTPSSSPDRTSHLGLLDIPTPMDSINKSELPYPDDLVHTKSKVSNNHIYIYIYSRCLFTEEYIFVLYVGPYFVLVV